MTGRWSGVPAVSRAVAWVAVAALTYGALAHVVHLAVGGGDPYPSVPRWLAGYYVSLTILDPLAAFLLLRRSRVGIVLACAVLTTDAAANVQANFVLGAQDSMGIGRVVAVAIGALAVALLASAPRLWPTQRDG